MAKLLSNRALSALTMELSLLLHAGVSVADALDLLGQEAAYRDVLAGWQTDDGWEPDMSLFGKIQFETSLTTTDPNAPATESAQ